jgi:hypothetical protein
MPNIHIIPNGDRWNVKEEDGGVVSTHDTQAEAEKPVRPGCETMAVVRSSPTATKESSREFARETPSKLNKARFTALWAGE